MKCFDVVNDVVEEASRQFSPGLRLVEERLEVLKEYCGAIDRIAEMTDAESFEAEIIEPGLTVKITIECAAFQIEDMNNPFYELADRSVSFGFEAAEDGNVAAFFEFPRLWEIGTEAG